MPEREEKLRAYEERRHFERTPEPAGEGKSPFAAGPIFVIQKHDASNLHYDFRLEVNGFFRFPGVAAIFISAQHFSKRRELIVNRPLHKCRPCSVNSDKPFAISDKI